MTIIAVFAFENSSNFNHVNRSVSNHGQIISLARVTVSAR